MITRAFVTGFKRTAGTQMNIRVFDQGMAESAIQVIVEVAGDMTISSALIQYIIFSHKSEQYGCYGDIIMRKAFSSSELLNLHKLVYDSPYHFFGFASLSFNRPGPFTLDSEMGNDFYMRIDTQVNVDSFAISYAIFGVPPATGCTGCSEPYAYGNTCVLQCPPGSYPFNYNDNGKGCRICPKIYHMAVNHAQNDCTCDPGYAMQNGMCIGSGLPNIAAPVTTPPLTPQIPQNPQIPQIPQIPQAPSPPQVSQPPSTAGSSYIPNPYPDQPENREPLPSTPYAKTYSL